jgi:large subunit ribosomal protein L16
MVTKKYKKYHKIKKVLKNANNNLRAIKKGIYGLKVIEFGVITPKQLETARRLISKITKRTGKSIINICFNLPLTKKPLSSRMGKGCGSIDY